VPVAFFFEGAPAGAGEFEPALVAQEAAPPAYVTDDPMAPERLALLTAFMRVKDPKMRNNIIRLIEEIAPAAGAFDAPDDQGN
jgi:hypothetical protein